MKWSAIVIGVLLCLMPMAFAQQPEAEETDVITENLPSIIGGIFGSGLGGGILGTLGGGILGVLSSAVGTCCVGLPAVFDYSILNSLMAIMGNVITWCAGIPTAEGLDWFEGILDTCLSIIPSILLGGGYVPTAWAAVSSCLLGTLSGYLGLFLSWGPLALCCWPVTAAIALFDGCISAILGTICGFSGGCGATIISYGAILCADFIPPLGICMGDTMPMALTAGFLGGIIGVFFGALLGAILGFFSGLPLAVIGCIPGAFNGALLGAISGLITGFGTGFIAAGWH